MTYLVVPVSPMQELLSSLDARGIKLWVEGERLRFSAAEGALTPELRAQLQAVKPELIAWLRDEAHTSEQEKLCQPSFAQRRFWALQQLNPTDSFYNVPFAFHLRGELDSEILRQSFNSIVRRHESLRTTLQMRDGVLMQVIAPEGEVNLNTQDLRGWPDAARAAALERILHAEMQRPFDLARESGLRVLLVRADEQEHTLLLCLHNTLYDQTSLLVLLKELSTHYTAFVGGASVLLPPPTQYAEYAEWQQTSFHAKAAERLSYWREWFGRGEPPAWEWIPSRPAPPAPSFHTHVPWMRFSPEVTQQLSALSRRHGVTLFTLLLAAYATLLRRYTGCDDLTIGTTYSDRQHWKFASVVGATIDVPALRIPMTDDPDLLTLLTRVREVVSAATTYQDVPFDSVAPALARTAPGPLFRMVFSFFPETAHGRLQIPGVKVTYLEELINELSRPALYLVLSENQTPEGDVVAGYFMHKQDVFSAETAGKMCAEFRELVAAIAKTSRLPAEGRT